MPGHKHSIGERVTVWSRVKGRPVWMGEHEVTRLLPDDGGTPNYSVKSCFGAQDATVREPFLSEPPRWHGAMARHQSSPRSNVVPSQRSGKPAEPRC